jgi:hypothetical protein
LNIRVAQTRLAQYLVKSLPVANIDDVSRIRGCVDRSNGEPNTVMPKRKLIGFYALKSSSTFSTNLQILSTKTRSILLSPIQ